MTNIDTFHRRDSRMRVKSARLRRRARNDPEGAFRVLLTTLASYFFLPSFLLPFLPFFPFFLSFHNSLVSIKLVLFTFVDRTQFEADKKSSISFRCLVKQKKKESPSWSLCSRSVRVHEYVNTIKKSSQKSYPIGFNLNTIELV